MPEARPYSWKREHKRLWEALVPSGGQADTLQGELIRIVGKLTDQAYRNGNMNWDEHHENMWRFVGRHLDDPSTFTAAECSAIDAAVEEIIRDEARPDLSGDGSCYYLLCERAVDWCIAHPTPIPHQDDPTLPR